MAWQRFDNGMGGMVWGSDDGRFYEGGDTPGPGAPADLLAQVEAAKGPTMNWNGLGQARPGDFTNPEENEFFWSAVGPEGEHFSSPKAAAAGETFRGTMQQLLARDPTGHLAARVASSGYFKQFADYDPDIEGQVVASSQNSGDATPGGMLQGLGIHLTNMAEDWGHHPLGAAVGPVGGSAFGGTSSDFMGRPSDSTYADMQNKGADPSSYQVLANTGAMIGMAAAGAGISNAIGAGGATPTDSSGFTQLAEGGNTMTDVPLTGDGSTGFSNYESAVDAQYGDPVYALNTPTNTGEMTYGTIQRNPLGSGTTNSLTNVAGGGTSGLAGPVAGGAGTGTALSRLLDGNAGTADYLSLLGSGLSTGLGVFGATQQAKSLQELANQYMEIGAPSRARYESSFAPNFTMANDPGYTDALDQTTKSFLHKASIGGNPADSPNAWQQTLKDVNSQFAYPALQDYRKLNANAGGLSRFAEAAPGAATGAIGAQNGVYNAVGAGAADIFNPPKSLSDILREMQRSGYAT